MEDDGIRAVLEDGDHVLVYSYNCRRNRLTGPYGMTVVRTSGSTAAHAVYDRQYPHVDVSRQRPLPRGIDGTLRNGDTLTFWVWNRDDAAAREFVREYLRGNVGRTTETLSRQMDQLERALTDMDTVNP